MAIKPRQKVKSLDKGSCEPILHKIREDDLFSGIEKKEFTTKLINSPHHCLFSFTEIAQFCDAANYNDLLEPIKGACQRSGGEVLWGVIDILLETKDCPGAQQHANISTRLQQVCLHIGTEQDELDWNTKEFVAKFTDFLMDKMEHKEYQALANEILDNCPPSSQEEIKEHIHAAVLKENISLYQIGKCLLARQELFPYVFEITEFTKAPIINQVKEILKKHLGQFWEQLAEKMGLNMLEVATLKNKSPHIYAQINELLDCKLQFPRLPTMEQTASLLVEIMEKASLPEVANKVRRDFLSTFQLNEDEIYLAQSNVSKPTVLQALFSPSQVTPLEVGNTQCSPHGQNTCDTKRHPPEQKPKTVIDLFELFKEEFLQDGTVPAQKIARRLYDGSVIPQEIETEIMSAKCDYAAASILYRHMTAQANKESAKKLFDIMINTKACQKMNDLGQRMLDALQNIE